MNPPRNDRRKPSLAAAMIQDLLALGFTLGIMFAGLCWLLWGLLA